MKRTITLASALAAALAGCSTPTSSPVATLDLARIQSNWPKFINYSNQLASDTDAINRSSASPEAKRRSLDALRSRYAAMQNEVTSDVRGAAQRVASDKHLTLVVTRQFVGYGGTDITPDVEKILQIVEKTPQKS